MLQHFGGYALRSRGPAPSLYQEIPEASTNPNEGSRRLAGAGTSDRDQYLQQISRGNTLAEMERHITGRIYNHARATPYDSNNLFNRQGYFFEQAKPESFTVQDCFVHAFNGAVRYPLFVDRK